MIRVDVDFSGVELQIAVLSETLARRLAADWEPFRVAKLGRAWLRFEVSFVEREAPDGPFRPKRMTSAFEVGGARFALPQGEAEVGEEGEARIRLMRATPSTTYFAMLNLLRACLAWSLPSRGAALLHAAGLVIDGRSFVLVGAEGSGKTTWARIGESRGAHVLSDDLVLVERAGDGFEALGSPFRSTHRSHYRPGRWPVAAVLFPRHGDAAAWETCDPLRARARLTANLPFIAAAIERDDRVAEVVERLVTEVPCRELTFARNPSFVDLLRSEAAEDA